MSATFPLLALAADVVDDLERVRIANENRLRQLTRTEADSDGEVRGFGLPEEHPDVIRLVEIVNLIGEAEKDSIKSLQRLMRTNDLGPWGKSKRGIGEKQLARLLAAIGNPYIRPTITREDGSVLPEGPRSLTSLYAYSGLIVDENGVAVRRRRGVKTNWSNTAKMRAYVIAESCIKQLDRSTCEKNDDTSLVTHVTGCGCSEFRIVYDNAKQRYSNALHSFECVRCGPSGKPAQAGSALSDGHKHMRAVRSVMKAVLRSLYYEAKRIHMARELDLDPFSPQAYEIDVTTNEFSAPVDSQDEPKE